MKHFLEIIILSANYFNKAQQRKMLFNILVVIRWVLLG